MTDAKTPASNKTPAPKAESPQAKLAEEDASGGKLDAVMSAVSKAKEMQQKVTHYQSELSGMSFTGEAADGLVEVRCDGNGRMTGVKIDPSLVKEDQPVAILEELILSAAKSAGMDAHTASERKAKEMTGGLPIPASLAAMISAIVPQR